MKCFLLFLGIYLIGACILKVECTVENDEGHKIKLREEEESKKHNERVTNHSTLADNGSSTSTQEHFGTKLTSVLRETITNLLSPANTQTISLLLTLLPTFPPAAIIGSFIMVILSILQSPSALSLLQNILPSVRSVLGNLRGISTTNYSIDMDRHDVNVLDAISEAAAYGTELAFPFINDQNTNASPYLSFHPKLDRFAEAPKMDDRTKKFLKRSMHSKKNYEGNDEERQEDVRMK